MLTTDKSQYFAHPCPIIIVYYASCCFATVAGDEEEKIRKTEIEVMMIRKRTGDTQEGHNKVIVMMREILIGGKIDTETERDAEEEDTGVMMMTMIEKGREEEEEEEKNTMIILKEGGAILPQMEREITGEINVVLQRIRSEVMQMTEAEQGVQKIRNQEKKMIRQSRLWRLLKRRWIQTIHF